MQRNKQRRIKIIGYFFITTSLFCSCANPKTAQLRPVTLYANNNYAVQIQADGTVKYLYPSDYNFGSGETRYPTFQAYTSAGIVEGERFEESLEILSASGTWVRKEPEMPDDVWEGRLAYEETPTILQQVEGWSNLVQLVGDKRYGYAALKSDGTVISIGVVNSVWENTALAENWTDVVHIVSDDGVIYGLKQDGTIYVHTQRGDILDQMHLEKKLAAWTDIVQIAGGAELFALKSDKTVLSTASNFYAYKEWEGIMKIAASATALVGIKEDGTVVAECKYPCGFAEEDLAGWDEVEDIAVCNDYCIAIRQDGTVLKTKSED